MITIPWNDWVIASPLWLLLLLLLPLWLFGNWGRGSRSEGQVPMAGVPVLLELNKNQRDAFTFLKYLALWGAVIALVFALSRPQTHESVSTNNAEVVDIVLAIDVSSSMSVKDFLYKGYAEPRINAAKRNAIAFVKKREGDRIGAVAYAGRPYSVSPITFDKDWVQSQIAALTLNDLPREDDGTAIGSAISAAYLKLSKKEAKSKIIVLLTDGANNSGKIKPIEAAKLCATKGVKIYTIAIGTEGGRIGRNIPALPQQEFDEETLKEIAKVTGGAHYRAQDTDQLKSIFSKIDSLEKTEVEQRSSVRVEEHFLIFLFVGFVLLVLALIFQAFRLPPLP